MGDPGLGRVVARAAARRTGRPAEADMDADPKAAAEDPLSVSPDPAAEDRR